MIVHFDIFVKQQSRRHKILCFGDANILHSEDPLVKLSNCRFMSISSDWPTGRRDRLAQEAEITERFQRMGLYPKLAYIYEMDGMF
jgi:hypothetical protein